MPVSFTVAQHGAKPVTDAKSSGRIRAQGLLPPQHQKVCTELLQSSFGRGNALLPPTEAVAFTGGNGLVDTVVRAYNQHHALILRPDDIWLAILVLFSFFVNAPRNSERLRHNFVAHEGKKHLVVTAVGTRYTVDFGAMAEQMTGLLAENVLDDTLRDWIMPNFSTTTPNDKVVGSVLMMATLKSYFTYGFSLTCGIPRITLEGERSDWEEIERRVEKIADYGDDAPKWHRQLKPILKRIVATFDDPSAQSDFWARMVHYERGGSGPDHVSGWITAFAAFNNEGKWLGDVRRGSS